MKRNELEAGIEASGKNDIKEQAFENTPIRDTMEVTDIDGHKMMIMNAVKNKNGEMVATDVIKAAKVTAEFRNAAERNGYVDLSFRITVPRKMTNSDWQLRLYPELFIQEDSISLDPVLITGTKYRKEQLRGYQQYERFLKSIISDSTRFINAFQLEIFIRRNIPALYNFKTDSSCVSDKHFNSIYGITEQRAVKHYTNHFRVRENEKRKAKKHEKYCKYVKVPITSSKLKLDTVIRDEKGNFIYDYIQTIKTRPKMKKAEIKLKGEIFETDKKIYSIPESRPVTFYISSISTLSDQKEKYTEKIITRKAEANTACYIYFEPSSSDIEAGIEENKSEIDRIKSNLRCLMDNKLYDMDSIIVTASCSPEGNAGSNKILAQKRAEAVSAYFQNYIKSYSDSAENARGFSINVKGKVEPAVYKTTNIEFIARSNPENWNMLDKFIEQDTVMSKKEKSDYMLTSSIVASDAREKVLRKKQYYKHIRTVLYPRLRIVGFDFYLHRKGMSKDTVHTTVPDSIYAKGVNALSMMDYKTALTLLRPYGDYNTAIAYCALNYNASALSILEKLNKTAKVNYLMAIIYSRDGNDDAALKSYRSACRQNKNFIYRGNLDPEITVLIKKYRLNNNN
ncbi:MAG: OmpA family protein [Bacteroidales bacterium]|nr:OmpA family protein [Bacteroidales bacterium]